MNRKWQKAILAVLGVVLVIVWVGSFQNPGGITAVLTGTNRMDRFIVPNPSLRLDLLERISKLEYSGMHRNIFKSTPLPPPEPPRPAMPLQPVDARPAQPVDPPLVLPFKFYGYVSDAHAQRLRGFFSSGEDIMVAAEGETVARRFRLVRLTVTRAELEEISTGKKATLQLDESAAPSGAS